MTTYKLPSGLASATDEVSGGYSFEITVPGKAKERNAALDEAMSELLKLKNENEKLRDVIEILRKAGNRCVNYNHTGSPIWDAVNEWNNERDRALELVK